ncbi:hypothetical protein HYPDE_38483 [Hyphomicrobium denitrificans 1NES1]|uniref:Transmembrane protein n=1 Tax=Hyphomicrobium denitrificans 1NES1 TaxID=670307 RepID=N0BFW8_9HYPH|nr:hypothetical protein [Hyphomicrobium denitrificans]AGK59366.1 hypothetical protein HYPDE_38483 [Hyphomicrobium denitrificans 1NES1]
MNALNDRFAFEAVLRDSELAAALNLRNVDEALADLQTSRSATPSGVTALSVLAGLGIISAIVFVTGYSALLSDTPAVWIHRLMALTVAQSILIAAVAMKLLPLIERRRFSVRIASGGAANQRPLLDQRTMTSEQPAPLPAPAPRKPFIGGKLAGREFLEFDDGSIEIDTLVGRRRFVSLDAAREFVGA